MDPTRIARKILKGNVYLTLGTTDGQKPWTAPLYYARGPKNELDFI